MHRALAFGLLVLLAIPSTGEILTGTWTLRIEDLEHRSQLTASVRFSDEAAGSCMAGIWRQVIVDKQSAELIKVMQNPEVRESFSKLGMQAASNTPDELGILTKTELAKWTKVVKEANIKPE